MRSSYCCFGTHAGSSPTVYQEKEVAVGKSTGCREGQLRNFLQELKKLPFICTNEYPFPLGMCRCIKIAIPISSSSSILENCAFKTDIFYD